MVVDSKKLSVEEVQIIFLIFLKAGGIEGLDHADLAMFLESKGDSRHILLIGSIFHLFGEFIQGNKVGARLSSFCSSSLVRMDDFINLIADYHTELAKNVLNRLLHFK